MADPQPPTRSEIEDISRGPPEFKDGRFVEGKPNFRVVKALERLFQVAGQLTPEDVQSLSIAVSLSSAAANQAISAINQLSDAILLAALAPRDELGTLAAQNAENVNIDGGTIDDVIITGGNVDDANINNPIISGGNADNIDIENSNFDNGNLDNDTITGSTITGTTFSGGSVGSVITDSTANLIASSAALGNGAGAAAGTLTNAPAAGNPTKWVPIDDNGTTRFLPAW